MRYAILFADDKGESHFDDLEIEFTATDYVQSAAPLGFSTTLPASQAAFMRASAGWTSDSMFRLRETCSLCLAVSGR